MVWAGYMYLGPLAYSMEAQGMTTLTKKEEAAREQDRAEEKKTKEVWRRKYSVTEILKKVK